MSHSCAFNVKLNNTNKEIKEQLKKICEKYHLGIFYDNLDEDNWIGYREVYDIAFHLSDASNYDTLTILDTCFIREFNESSFKLFEEKFYFLQEYVKLFLDFNAQKIEVYISSCAPNDYEDYSVIKTSYNGFLHRIYEEIIEQSNLWSYGFPVLKIEIV